MKTSPEQVAEALRVSLKESERLRQRNRRLQEAAAEPIAIVGMSCRFPNRADSPARLWQLLASGGDAIGAFPTDREWDLDALHDPDLGLTYVREGGFLGRATEFDNDFFGISPREALGMDAQERLLLESAWETLEDAGLEPDSLRGSRTGVFAGTMYHDYGWGLSPSEESAAHLATGGTSSIVPGRISYTLGFEGPAISVDTACSSSLVALHLAAQALRGGECELALAGGATVYSTPGVFIQFGRQRVLSPDGRCKAFADGADGAGFSEGVGMVLLERLSDAQRNGHRVLATIRGSAVNQDGASNGMTAPNGPAQERVIRQALENARLTAGDVEAIEAHGTGTALGDPIEAGALLATYGSARPDGDPLLLGSIKSNIGHPQAAAGIAGVIKMVLALRADLLPKTLHVDRPSTKIDWSAGQVELLTEARPWLRGDRPRRAGISSFGATGTNAHLILEEAPQPESADDEDGGDKGEAPAKAPLPGVVLLPLSAKTEPALREAVARLGSHLESHPDVDPLDAAYSLATGRTAFERRATIVGGDRETVLAGLAALGEGEAVAALAQGRASAGKVAYVFSGHGGQWQGMGVELLDASPAFAAHLAACEEALAPLVDWSLEEVLREEGGEALERLDVVQPALFATMVSLAKLWRECGVEPSVVLGHSLGEIAAAHLAGGLSLPDAALLVTVRSRLIAKLLGQGALASIALAPDRLEARLREWEGRIEVAALNGPNSAIVSGETEALDELLESCEAEGVRTRRLPTSMASHSKQVEVLREELLEALAPISPRSGEIPFHSTVTGEAIDTAELGPEYWYRNLRETVRLEPAVRSLVEGGCRTLIEMGPHPVLAVGLQETVEAVAEEPDSVAVVPSLRRGEGGPERFALSLAQAQAGGAPVDWEAIFAGSGAKRVPLPTYPFQRRRFWLGGRFGGTDLEGAGVDGADHPLLGAAVRVADGDALLLAGRLSLESHPWLADHVYETVLLPGTAFVELALKAGAEVGCETIEDLALGAPLLLPERGSVAIQVLVSPPSDDGRRELSIHSRPDSEEDGEWSRHATGTLSPVPLAPPRAPAAWPPPGAQPLQLDGMYERLADCGLVYGPAFQCVDAAWSRGEELFVEMSLAGEQGEEAPRFGLHPALLDASSHVGFDRMIAAADGEPGPLGLPFAWRGVRYFAADGPGSMRVRIAPHGDGLTFEAFDAVGAPVALVESVVTRAAEPGSLGAASERVPIYRVEWPAAQAPDAETSPSLALLGPEQLSGLAAERFDDLAALEEATEAGRIAPQAVLVDARAGAGEVPAGAHAASRRALDLVKAWAAAKLPEQARLVFLTEGAVSADPDERPDLATAPIWGLVRSAHSEHPGRFGLVDVDGAETSWQAVPSALALPEEPQVAIRRGEVRVPRLASATVLPEPAPSERLDPEATVLVTGGTSGIGARVARHLVAEWGARQLLLVSRSGETAAGAAELREELQGLGATVRIAACDVADRERLRELLDSIPESAPLGMVVHSAAVIADGVLESQDAERLERVMRAKVDAAWHLHELTQEMPLSHFVLFSSAAGLLGGAGQTNYAAANAFLDALAQHRAAIGLPAAALAWGLWQQETQLMEIADRAEAEAVARRIRERLAVAPMSPARGLELFDRAIAREEPLLMAAELDPGTMRTQARAGALPAVLRGLVRLPRRRARGDDSLAARLAAVDEGDRLRICLDLVRDHAAAVLGLAGSAEVDPERSFRDIGFDSLGAVELRNRMVAATGLSLPATIVFDHPSPGAVAEHLLAALLGEGRVATAPVPNRSFDGEPIAIVGMACRYPGGVASPADLWKLLEMGGDAISPLPTDRGWDLERFYDPDPESQGTFYIREAGMLADAAEFDAAFFNVSPREAATLDPQERLLLEACWEALEDGGIDPSSLRGSPTGIFAGVMYQDYGRAAGMSSSRVSGRVAYAFGLEGPTMSVDTACSSSLVSLHLAAQALRQGECSLALAGGVTVASTPGMLVYFSSQRGLAMDGRCKAFAEEADGTGVSEGVGVLLLERLSDAEANGHSVLATIKGSAVNQDGASNGFTAPNGPSQERVIRAALANAGLTPQDVDAIEAHGTGTALGDPIEAGALFATYGQEREQPLRLGSIKSNIGHAQAAAGVAGVIKMTLAMREGVLPRTLHAEQPSSKIDWSSGAIELLSEAAPWEPNGGPRRAGISSFGASGTNAHLLLEEAPPRPAPEAATQGAGSPAESLPLSGPLLFPLSAKTEPALREAARRLEAHLRRRPELEPVDVAHSLATTRGAFEWRAGVVASSREQLLEALTVVAGGGTSPEVVFGRARSGPLAFLFSGQGSQRPGMGRELYEVSSVYRGTLDEVCALLDPELDRPLRDLLFADLGSTEAALLDRTTYAQPALFATGVALHRLLAACGLRPELLAGHSIGEIAAAHVAGVFSLADAAKLVAARGRLMGELPEGGAMVAIEASEEEVAAELSGCEAELSIAAVNGPRAVVVSGRSEAAEEIASRFAERGAKTKRLAVSHAFHSPLIEPMLEDFARIAEGLDFDEPKVPIVSGVSGEVLDPATATDPGYWVEHVREPVRFADVVEAIAARGASACVELGPDPVLLAMAETCLANAGADTPALVPTLRQGRDEADTLAAALATAHAAGAKLDRRAFFAAATVKRVPLPTYPFERKRYWEDAAGASPDVRAAGQMPAAHPLLGAKIEHPSGRGLTLTGSLSLASQPWLADHAVAGSAMLPGAAFLDLVLVAAREVGCETVAELVLQEPLVLRETGALRLQVSVGAAEEGRREVTIHTCPVDAEDGDWNLHAHGVLSEDRAASPDPLQAWPPAGAEELEPEDLYASLAAAGIEYGPAFRGLTAAWRAGETVYAEVAVPEDLAQSAERFAVHPVLLDSAGHAALGAMLDGAEAGLSLPFAWSGVCLRSRGAARLRVRIDGGGLVAFDEAGEPVLSVGSLSTRPLDPALLQKGARRRFMHELRWLPAPRAAAATEPGEVASWRWQDGGESAEAAAAALAAIQAHLTEDRSEPLAILTEGAVCAREGESPEPAAAAIWGLVRSAQAEHPGRFLLIDGEGAEPTREALALADDGESQLALRDGELLMPRLERTEAAVESSSPLDPERAVLVTGAGGGLGGLVARYLAEKHGARHLLLVGRSGASGPAARSLLAELAELGAEASFAAVDVGDRAALEEALAAASAEQPIGAVFHCAGQLDDGVVDSLDAERIERVFRPKADGARHLHELLREAPLSHFVVFSSAAGVLGSPGQGNYAAANAYCDALAQRRRAEGLPATSLAWGPWEVGGGMGEGLDDADRARLARTGFLPLASEEGLDLLDAALAAEEPALVPIAFEPRALRARAKAGALAPPLRGLVRLPADEEASGPSLTARLGAAGPAGPATVVTDFVRENVAAVLGHAGVAEIEPQRAFSELGFDSLAAVELRNRLSAGSGLRLPPTLIFDYPTAESVAAYLLGELDPGSSGDPTEAREREIEQVLLQLEQALAGVDGDERLRALLDGRLRSLLAGLSGAAADEPALDEEGLASLSHEEVFELIDQELGAS